MATLNEFFDNLEKNKYGSATGARRAIGKLKGNGGWSEEDVKEAHRAVNETFKEAAPAEVVAATEPKVTKKKEASERKTTPKTEAKKRKHDAARSNIVDLFDRKEAAEAAATSSTRPVSDAVDRFAADVLQDKDYVAVGTLHVNPKKDALESLDVLTISFDRIAKINEGSTKISDSVVTKFNTALEHSLDAVIATQEPYQPKTTKKGVVQADGFLSGEGPASAQ